MKLSSVKSSFIEQLSSFYDSEELLSFFYQLVETYLKENRFVLHLNPDYELNDHQLIQFNEAITALKNYEPIQYIIGSTEFLSLELKVHASALIPRPETEDMILYLESYIKTNKIKRILDVGTGTGCIGLSLKQRESEAIVDLMDVSTKALELAGQNADLNHLRANLIQANVLELDSFEHKYDLIVSNPPYIRSLEKEQMKPNVLEHEPHLALFVPDDDPLLFYRKIAKLAKLNLNTGGMLCFEINEAFGKQTMDLLDELGFREIKLINDRYSKDRIVSALQ